MLVAEWAGGWVCQIAQNSRVTDYIWLLIVQLWTCSMATARYGAILHCWYRTTHVLQVTCVSCMYRRDTYTFYNVTYVRSCCRINTLFTQYMEKSLVWCRIVTRAYGTRDNTSNRLVIFPFTQWIIYIYIYSIYIYIWLSTITNINSIPAMGQSSQVPILRSTTCVIATGISHEGCILYCFNTSCLMA